MYEDVCMVVEVRDRGYDMISYHYLALSDDSSVSVQEEEEKG